MGRRALALKNTARHAGNYQRGQCGGILSMNDGDNKTLGKVKAWQNVDLDVAPKRKHYGQLTIFETWVLSTDRVLESIVPPLCMLDSSCMRQIFCTGWFSVHASTQNSGWWFQVQWISTSSYKNHAFTDDFITLTLNEAILVVWPRTLIIPHFGFGWRFDTMRRGIVLLFNSTLRPSTTTFLKRLCALLRECILHKYWLLLEMIGWPDHVFIAQIALGGRCDCQEYLYKAQAQSGPRLNGSTCWIFDCRTPWNRWQYHRVDMWSQTRGLSPGPHHLHFTMGNDLLEACIKTCEWSAACGFLVLVLQTDTESVDTNGVL